MDCSRIHNLEMKEFALTILKSACNNSKIVHKDKNYTEIYYNQLIPANFENMEIANYNEHLKSKYNKNYQDTLEYIVDELKEPYKISNLSVNELNSMELFYKLSGESMESFYEGITTQVKVINVMTNEKYSGLRVSTDSGIEGKIDIKDIKDLGPDEQVMNPEELKTIAKVGM